MYKFYIQDAILLCIGHHSAAVTLMSCGTQNAEEEEEETPCARTSQPRWEDLTEPEQTPSSCIIRTGETSVAGVVVDGPA